MPRRVTRRSSVGCACAIVGILLLGAPACVTFSKDVERARAHYDKSEFPEALALLRVIDDDVGALSPRERVEYAYLRGMTDFHLAEASPGGATRDAFRAYATTYLKQAADLARATPDGLGDLERVRLQQTLARLEGRADDADADQAP